MLCQRLRPLQCFCIGFIITIIGVGVGILLIIFGNPKNSTRSLENFVLRDCGANDGNTLCRYQARGFSEEYTFMVNYQSADSSDHLQSLVGCVIKTNDGKKLAIDSRRDCENTLSPEYIVGILMTILVPITATVLLLIYVVWYFDNRQRRYTVSVSRVHVSEALSSSSNSYYYSEDYNI